MTVAGTAGTIAVTGCLGDGDDTDEGSTDGETDSEDTNDDTNETGDENGTDSEEPAEEEDATVEDAISIVDHDFYHVQNDGIHFEITVQNNTEGDQSATILVEVYNDDSLLDDRTLLADMSAGSTTTENGLLANLETSDFVETNDIEKVTHYDIRAGLGIGGDTELMSEHSGDELREKYNE